VDRRDGDGCCERECEKDVWSLGVIRQSLGAVAARRRGGYSVCIPLACGRIKTDACTSCTAYLSELRGVTPASVALHGAVIIIKICYGMQEVERCGHSYRHYKHAKWQRAYRHMPMDPMDEMKRLNSKHGGL
jgi:hypothetical protein